MTMMGNLKKEDSKLVKINPNKQKLKYFFVSLNEFSRYYDDNDNENDDDNKPKKKHRVIFSQLILSSTFTHKCIWQKDQSVCVCDHHHISSGLISFFPEKTKKILPIRIMMMMKKLVS